MGRLGYIDRTVPAVNYGCKPAAWMCKACFRIFTDSAKASETPNDQLERKARLKRKLRRNRLFFLYGHKDCNVELNGTTQNNNVNYPFESLGR